MAPPKRVDFPLPGFIDGGPDTNKLLVRYFYEGQNDPVTRTFTIVGFLDPVKNIKSGDIMTIDYRVDRGATEILLQIVSRSAIPLISFGAIVDAPISPFLGNYIHDLSFMTELWSTPSRPEPMFSAIRESTYPLHNNNFLF